jgi:uncharacterized membrane protein
MMMTLDEEKMRMSTSAEDQAVGSDAPGQISLRRLERLADIIFGLALLLLLATIDFAPEESASAEEAYRHLAKQVGQSFSFIVSFLIIAYYWISHQEYFSYFKRTNKIHAFIELIYLMTIAGMPFNNDFIASFPMEVAPRLAISSDIFAAGMLSFFSWVYATSGNRFVDAEEISPKDIAFMRYQALVMPACAIVAAGAALLNPFAWDVILTVGPLMAIFLIKRRIKK